MIKNGARIREINFIWAQNYQYFPPRDAKVGFLKLGFETHRWRCSSQGKKLSNIFIILDTSVNKISIWITFSLQKHEINEYCTNYFFNQNLPT